VQLKDLLSYEVVCCTAESTAAEAAQLMRERHVGDLVVVQENGNGRQPLGLVTDRDLVVDVMARRLDPTAVRVSTLVRTPVVIAQEDEDSADVIERMRMHGVRRIPVVGEGGAVVGIITSNDLLRALNTEVATLLDVVQKGQRNEQHRRR